MSRTRHKLQSEDWYGDWAQYFHRENREMRQRGREKRRRDTIRVDQDEYQRSYELMPEDFDDDY